MKPKLRKIFDIQALPRNEANNLTDEAQLVWDESHHLSCTWAGNGNDSWYEYTIGGFVDKEVWGFTTLALDAWLTGTGMAQKGETVMIKHWW